MALRCIVALLLVSSAVSHLSMWHASTFDADRGNMNSDSNSQPLQDFKFADWWWHRNLNFPPDYTKPNTTFLLPANGVAIAELSSNKAFTSIGYRGFNQRDTPNPWSDKWSNIHAPAHKDVAGCAWGIAYKSNQFDVKPEDFVIFSVAHDCPARQVQPFKVPNLPACPNGRCMCAWFWIHKSIGGSDQMYMTPFVCKVTGAKADAPAVDVANAVAPRKCNTPTYCTRGPRNPMYWKNLERNNMAEPGHFAPTYSILYGFSEGAQNDIFTTTNPRRGNAVKPFPTEVKCTKMTINPKLYGSRLASNGLSSLADNVLFSPNCAVMANFQAGDGNLIVRNTTTGNVLWTAAFEPGQSPHKFALQNDGLISIKDSNGKQVWSSEMTQGVGKAPYRLELINSGVLVLIDGTGRNIWESWFFDNRENDFNPLARDPAVWRN